MISFDEFKKMEIKVAEVMEVKDHQDADKLYVMKIKIGEDEREIVAGIKPYYKPSELIGKQIVVVTNLEPATIRGIESQAMLLAAQDESTISVLTPDKAVKSGSSIG